MTPRNSEDPYRRGGETGGPEHKPKSARAPEIAQRLSGEERTRRRRERRLKRYYRVESRYVTRLKQVALALFLAAGAVFLVYAFFFYD